MMNLPKHIVKDKRTLSVQTVVFAPIIKTNTDLKNNGMTISLPMEQVPNTIARLNTKFETSYNTGHS